MSTPIHDALVAHNRRYLRIRSAVRLVVGTLTTVAVAYVSFISFAIVLR